MTTATRLADAPLRIKTEQSGVLQQAWAHRADYLYVLPAIVVMLIVIAYPIYYTIELSFFNTPPESAAARQDLRRLRQLFDHPQQRRVLARHRQHIHLDVRLDRVLVRPGVGRRARSAPRFRRSGRVARYSHHSVGHQRGRRVLYLEVDLSFGFRSHRRRSGGLGLADRPPNFIDSVGTVLPSLIVVNVWREFPFAMIMLMAGLQTVPDQLLRAAKVDGASAWQRFWHVTFPHLQGVSTVTDPAARGGELQFLHHSLDHDRRRPVERLPHLDNPHL